MGKEVVHVERHSYCLKKEDLQRILFDYYKVQTGNYGKIQFEEEVVFPIYIKYDELLEHDSRVKTFGFEPKKLAVEDSEGEAQ